MTFFFGILTLTLFFLVIFKQALNTFNFGIGLGAGYYFTDNIGVTARYVAGATDIFKENNGDAVRNNTFQVGLAYKF